jgi:hypothetical protein
MSTGRAGTDGSHDGHPPSGRARLHGLPYTKEETAVPYIIVRRPPRLSRMAVTAVALVTGALASSAPAVAATPAPPVCVTPSFSQVFLPWKDNALYTASPGGDFEGAMTNWSFGAGARVAPGNETFYVGGHADRASLKLPAGASVVSAPMCIDRTYPTFRFFARNLSAGNGTLQVDVLWQESGVRKTSKAGLDRKAATGWTPVKSLRLPSGALSTGRLEPVTFRFTAVGGSYEVDDLYVDPFMGR